MYYKHVSNKPRKLNWKTYTNPFEGSIWVLSTISMLCSYAVLFVMAKFDDNKFKDSVLSGVILVHGCSNQGTPYEPRAISSRIVFLVMFVTALLLWSCYSAVLTSSLATKIERQPFQNLEDLLARTSYKLVVQGGGFYESTLKVKRS